MIVKWAQTGQDRTPPSAGGHSRRDQGSGAVLLDARTSREHPWLMGTLQTWQQGWEGQKGFQPFSPQVTEETTRTWAVWILKEEVSNSTGVF